MSLKCFFKIKKANFKGKISQCSGGIKKMMLLHAHTVHQSSFTLIGAMKVIDDNMCIISFKF